MRDLWKEKRSNNWLGWLGLPLEADSSLFTLPKAKRKNSHIVLLGMGGSSLAPQVFSQIFDRPKDYSKFYVIDSTDSEQILAVEREIDLNETLFIVSSKSGSTLETNSLFKYFFDKSKNPKNFIAITDPGSFLEKLAQENNFLKIFYGQKNIGGRYSALSNFGLIPAWLMGFDTELIIKNAQKMREACRIMDPEKNPGAKLGFKLALLAKSGQDKITLVCSRQLGSLADWIEQLLAESTGKDGKGLIPIVGEDLGGPTSYSSDRVFVYISLAGDDKFDAQIERLEKSGQPIIRINVPDTAHIGAEFYRWEIATAHACFELGIDPFNQPDVEESKHRVIEKLKKPRGDGLSLDSCFRESRKIQIENFEQLVESIKPGDYFSIQAFVNMSIENIALLQKLRIKIRDSKGVATTLGFGPRFLHSTGQLHKGGPNSGVFLQITNNLQEELGVSGENYGFEQIKQAQALADFEVLTHKDRRILRISWDEASKLL